MNAQEQQLVQACKERLARHYGASLKGLILYGSMARGTAEPESDIDLLVLFGEPFDYFVELEVLVDLLYDLQLGSDRYLSVRPARVRPGGRPVALGAVSGFPALLRTRRNRIRHRLLYHKRRVPDHPAHQVESRVSAGVSGRWGRAPAPQLGAMWSAAACCRFGCQARVESGSNPRK
jgi:predicted nucleotidyltransferase